jgi:chromate transporter
VSEVAGLFLKLGVVGFGGPAAHIALMRDEVVRRRGWMGDEEFLDWVGATNLIPGPNSTELAIHIGHQRAGVRGLIMAGVCFIVPAVVIVSVLAWMYERYGTNPAVIDIRYGVLPVIIAIVAQAVVGLGRTAVKGVIDALLFVAAFVAFLAGVYELLILAVAGAVAALWTAGGRWRPSGRSLLSMPLLAVAATADVSLWRLFVVMLEIGSVLYGSGYVLLAFLQSNLVDGLGWLTSEQLLDAIAVGQITPGPVFTTATFVGWLIGGPAGATVATVGIFLPSFLFVAALTWLVPWIKSRPVARAFLGGVTVASLGLMAGVLVELTGTALVDAFTVLIAVVALGVLLRTTRSSLWLVAGGIAIGLIHAVVS